MHVEQSMLTMVKYACAVQEVAKGGFPFPSMFRALSAQGLSPQVSITEQQLVPVALPKPPVVPSTLGRKYASPLTVFRSYRYYNLHKHYLHRKRRSKLCAFRHCRCSLCSEAFWDCIPGSASPSL